jgi:hypothetical protein
MNVARALNIARETKGKGAVSRKVGRDDSDSAKREGARQAARLRDRGRRNGVMDDSRCR